MLFERRRDEVAIGEPQTTEAKQRLDPAVDFGRRHPERGSFQKPDELGDNHGRSLKLNFARFGGAQ